MSAKLPPEFDPERYFAAHPDVALTGLSPQDHYLRFGRLLGRDPRGRGASAKSTPSEKAAPPTPAPHIVSAADAALAAPVKKTLRSEPIIDRPKDLQPSQFVPVPAPAKPGAGVGNHYSLDAIAKGPFPSAEERDKICQPLVAYARMLSLDAPADVACSTDANECGAALFQSGETRLDNLWFAGPRLIRLMIHRGSGADAKTNGWSLRAYQAEPGTPGQLTMAGEGIQLPSNGPVFHDLPLADPLMPILFELSDEAGRTRALGLLPFPSLLPGGLHHAELRALQIEPNPVDAVWTLSSKLLAEMLDTGSPARSITSLAVEAERADEAEVALRSELRGWLHALFGLSMDKNLAEPKSEGLCLALPAASIPTIGALVSRGLDLGGADSLTGPFLVSEAGTNRPRWSIVLPPEQGDAKAPVPVLSKEARSSKGNKKRGALPVHLAILTRAARPISAPARVDHLPSSGQPLTVVLHSHDPEHTRALLSELKSFAGDSGLELFVRMPRDADQRIAHVLDEVIGAGRWQALASENVQELAAAARHDVLLTINDRVKLDGNEPLSELFELLNEDEAIGSVSCALIGEASLKSHSAARPTYAGLFPSRVSFATSPHLTFYEPDVTDALLNTAYPVIANSSALSLWRRSVLASLPQQTGPLSTGAADLRIGLEAVKAGYRNLCTTRARAELRGAYVPRDMIDPLGSTYLQPGSWENILGRVTILRELF